jgi:HK97 family phage major capsid protein
MASDAFRRPLTVGPALKILRCCGSRAGFSFSPPYFQQKRTHGEKMAHLITLRQRHHTQKKTLKAILDKAGAENRDLNPEEDRVYEVGLKNLASIGREIEIEEAGLDAERGAPAFSVTTGRRESSGALARRHSLDGKRYRDLFGATDRSDFADLNDFLKTVHSGLNDHRFSAVAQGLGENVPTDGGFLVPTEFAAEMLDVALESEIVRPRAMVYPMKSQTKRIAGLDDLDNSGGAPFGGFSIQWSNEGDAGTAKKFKTRMIELIAKKAMIFAFGSNELIADGMNFDELIGNAIVKSIGWGLDFAFLQGTGANGPLGVLNDPALIVVAKETGQATGTLLYANVCNMFSRCHPACRLNSVWVANSTIIPQLLQMQLVVSNRANTENVGGSATPVFAQEGGEFRLLTRPVIFTEKLPALSTQGDIILADFSQYAIGLRKEVSLERSIYAGWSTDESGYRAIIRVDGQGRWKSPFTPKSGSTLSWVVALATR